MTGRELGARDAGRTAVDDARTVLREYGVTDIDDITLTASELDRTWIVRAGNTRLVVKESPSGSTAAVMQAHLLEHLSRTAPALPTPRVLSAPVGGVVHPTSRGTAFVTTWCPGRPLEDVAITPALVDALADAQVALIGALDGIDPGRSHVPDVNDWSPLALPAYTALIDRHAAPRHRTLLRDVVRRHLDDAAPACARLPRHVVHADFNLSNILATDDTITGIIDFGDALYAPLVVDIAITACYLALAAGSVDHRLVGRYVHRATTALSLPPGQTELVRPLLLARLAIVVLLSREIADRRPERGTYVLRYDSHAERVLDALLDAGEDDGRPFDGGPAAAAMINRFDPRHAAEVLDPTELRLLQRRRAALGDIYPLFYERPLHVVRGDGTRLFDGQGREYLDAYNNVQAVGHSNPRVAEAVHRQLTRMNTHTRYLQDGIVDYAERHLATHPAHLDRMVFTNSGSESNDLAVTLARWRTGGHGVVVTANAYHGTTALLAALSPENGPGMPLAPWVRTVRPPDPLREGPCAGARFAADVRTAARDLAASGWGFAALMIDTILATDGIIPGPDGMLAAAFAAAHECGGLVVADEVQPGMGRLGRQMWGYRRHSDDVDLVTCGKPLAGGLPVGTLVLNSELSDGYAQDHRYFNTFGGNPVGIAAATAVLDEIEDRNLLVQACRTGDHLLTELRALHRRQSSALPQPVDIRGCGLYVGVEFGEHDGQPGGTWAARVVHGLRRRRVLISAVGRTGEVLKIRPPLVFGLADADLFLAAYEEVVSDLHHPPAGHPGPADRPHPPKGGVA